MSAAWKLQTERRLLEGPIPEVLRTSDLNMLVCCGRESPPSSASIARWQKDLVASGKLKEVIKGVYLNRLGYRNVGPGAAAHHIRFGAIVSLSCVLEDAGLTNNFGDTITCIIPSHTSWPNAQIGDRKTLAGTFRFFGMPAAVAQAGSLEDNADARFQYPRRTPERAFADWVYLGASVRSRLNPPPLDIDFLGLDQDRLRRLVQVMDIRKPFDTWIDRYNAYQADEDVQANAATGMVF
jgi:hypothetical protein